MNIKNFFETLKWQTTILRDPCNPVRDFKERMTALFSDDKSSDKSQTMVVGDNASKLSTNAKNQKVINMIDKKIIYIITFGIVFAFVSCTGTKKIAIDIEGDDVKELIIDNYKFPKHSEDIVNYLMAKDYASASYTELLQYQNLSIYDEQLGNHFNNILRDREDSVISALATKNIREIAEYYKSRPDEQDFLNPVLFETFVTNSDYLSYEDVKALSVEFSSTDLEDSLTAKFINRRNLIYPYADIYGEKYEDSILNLLSNMNIRQVGNYYRTHSYDQQFLKPILQNTYLPSINEFEYAEVKKLVNAFAGTDIHSIFASKYDSIRMTYKPIVKESIYVYIAAEQEVLKSYKAYAYEDVMNYLTNASGEIMADYIMPSLEDYWDAFCNNPGNFILNIGKGIVDGIVDAAVNAYNYVIDFFSSSDKNDKEEIETYDKIFYKNYDAHISKDDIMSIIDKYASDARNELNLARCSFVSEMTGTKSPAETMIKDCSNNECPTFGKISNISEIKMIYDRQNKDDVIGTILGLASWLPAYGDVISLFEIGYSLDGYDSDASYVKGKLDKFQDKMNDHIMQMAEFYIDSRFNEITENTKNSRTNLIKYIYENY